MSSKFRPAIALTVYLNDGDTSVDLDAPTHWVICPACDGDGENTWPDLEGGEEAGEDRYYCERCSHCKGTGKRLEVDEETFRADDPEVYAAWQKNLEDEERMNAMIASERRFGA